MKYVACLAAVFVLLVCGCNNNGSDTNPPNPQFRSKRIDLGSASTQKIIGWSTALGRLAQEQCFTYEVTEGADWQTESEFTTARTSEKESRDLGVDASISLKYGLFSGSDSFKYVDNSNENSLSVSAWFDASSTGTVEISNIQLNDTGTEAAEEGGAYFGLVCGDKVFTSLPLKLSTRYNINFQSSSYSNAQNISNDVTMSYSLDSISASIQDDFSEQDSESSLHLQWVTVGNPSLFQSTYLKTADEDACIDSGDCSAWSSDLLDQFANAAQEAGAQLKQDPTAFNSIYYVDYSKVQSGANLMDATNIPGVPADTSDPYSGSQSVIGNAVNVYADLLVAAKAMLNIVSNSDGAGGQTIDALNYYNEILSNYAADLYSQIDTCFSNPDQCNQIPEDVSIFNLIENDQQLDADTRAALKASVQALIYDVYTVQDWDVYYPAFFTAPQKLIYFTTFGPDLQGNNYKKVAATLNTSGSLGVEVMGGVFELAQFVFDKDTLQGTSFSEPSYTYNTNIGVTYNNNSVHLNVSAGRTNGTEDFQFLTPPPQTIDMGLLYELPVATTTLSFTPRLNYLPTINPFCETVAP